jgi:hypothetical protein
LVPQAEDRVAGAHPTAPTQRKCRGSRRQAPTNHPTPREGPWIASPGCLSVLVVVVGIKGASRPFGIEQVRLLTHTLTTREGRSYADPAEGFESGGHFGKVGRVAG